MSSRTWTCDVCQTTNNPNTTICNHCRQARSITPIQSSPTYEDAQENDQQVVNMPSVKPERHRRSHHGGRRESRRHSHREEPAVAEPVGLLVGWMD